MNEIKKFELILFTGESRHRYIEDTLLVLGAPNGYVIRFDYKKKYVDSSIFENFSKFIGKNALLISYSGELKENKLFPIRSTIVLDFVIEQDQIDIILELENYSFLREFKKNDFRINYNISSGMHVIPCDLSLNIFYQKEGFKSGMKDLQSFSEKFRNENIVFSYFDFKDKNGNDISLTRTKKKNNESNLDLLYFPHLTFSSLEEIYLHLYFFAPNIGSKVHFFKITESLSAPQNTIEFTLGASQIHYKYKIKPGLFWRNRNGRFLFTANTNYTLSQRLMFQTDLPKKKRTLLCIFFLVLIYALLYSLDTTEHGFLFKFISKKISDKPILSLTSNENLITILITFLKYSLIGTLSLVGVRYFTKETE